MEVHRWAFAFFFVGASIGACDDDPGSRGLLQRQAWAADRQVLASECSPPAEQLRRPAPPLVPSLPALLAEDGPALECR